MYITIGETNYRKIKNLIFSPQASMTTDELPINEFSADIITTDEISEGQYAILKDDLNNLWAKYWVYQADRKDETTVHIVAHSEIALLEYVTLPEIVYQNVTLENALEDIMVRQSGAGGIVAPIDYGVRESIKDTLINGYCPEQTARERLQWVCFVCGAFVKTFFHYRPAIIPLDTTAELVPRDKTFWKPTVNFGRRVTAIKATAYTFTEGTNTQAEVMNASSYTFPLPWICTEQTFTLTNPEATVDDGDNPIEVDELYLVNPSNVSDIMTRLAARYFPRESVDIDVINNAEYMPGDALVVYDDLNNLYWGVVESCDFSFGVQARARMHLSAGADVPGALLTINYMFGDTRIKREKYTLPVGYPYEITTLYIDKTEDGRRRIYRPTQDSVTGTMTSEGATVSVTCDVALEQYQGILHIYDVDDVTVNENNVAVIS